MTKSKLSKTIKNERVKSGLSQEELGEKSGLSLRTIQRIENSETDPRGDSLKRIAKTLGVSTESLIDWELEEDRNLIRMIHLSQLGSLAFPLLGIVIPLAIWIYKKSWIKNIDRIGQHILNFQITWSLSVFSLYIVAFLVIVINRRVPEYLPYSFFPLLAVLYMYNLGLIIYHSIRSNNTKQVFYRPSLKFLK